MVYFKKFPLGNQEKYIKQKGAKGKEKNKKERLHNISKDNRIQEQYL